MHPLDLTTAEALLDCRAGATREEVQSAYRRAVRRHRPDLDRVDRGWIGRVQAARDLLAAHAPPERRRRRRRGDPPGVERLRRATWGLVDPPERDVDLRL